MSGHRVSFLPSQRSAVVPGGSTLLQAAELCGEPLSAECGGRGSCGRCLVEVLEGEPPEHCCLDRVQGKPRVLACTTPVQGALAVRPLRSAQLPRLSAAERYLGSRPLSEWAPWPLALEPLCGPPPSDQELGVALDVGTTTLKLLLLRLSDGQVIGEAGAYNPQIPHGADCISRIMAAERGRLDELAGVVRAAVSELIAEAASESGSDPARIRGYLVAGNLTMIHLLLGLDPAGIRRVPPEPSALSFAPVSAESLGWPGGAQVFALPAAGAWVGGDIVSGMTRAGLSRAEQPTLYVDLGTNGELALAGEGFAISCACSAGPAFEGGGIRCGMRADRGAIDGVRLDSGTGQLMASVIGDGRPKGICGSGLIALCEALLRAGWVDRSGRFTSALPKDLQVNGRAGPGVLLGERGPVALYERDLLSLIRTKAAIFAGIRALLGSLGEETLIPRQLIISGNFGRFLNLPAAMGIGLLPTLELDQLSYLGNGSLEGAALALLSREFFGELDAYLRRITYVDLAELPGYMDEFVAASFLPHTSPERLRL